MKRLYSIILLISFFSSTFLSVRAANRGVASEIAGDYYFGHGTGVNCNLHLSAKCKFYFKWEGCLCTYDHNNGNFSVTNGILKLSPKRPNIEKGFQGTPTTFFIVPWDSRLYLIPTNKIIDFCCEINDGGEPRKARYGFYYVRENDWEKPVTGKPAVPAEWAKFLLSSPVRAKITELIGQQEAWIDAGSKQGLLEGMVLTAHNRENLMFSRVRIQSVEKNRCRIKCEWSDSKLEVGQMVSSLFFDQKP